VVAYKDDEKNGQVEYFHPNGQLKLKGWYTEDSPSGDWVHYNEKGKVTSRYSYLNGDYTGYYEYYYPNGKLDFEEVYDQGWLKAINQYDTLGKKIITATFKNGNGKYVSIHANGNKRFEADYVQGEFHGQMTAYFFDGSKRIEKTYDLGMLHGAYEEYYYGSITPKKESCTGKRHTCLGN
jgi:antitoxin component YwqK of YwqJK toxin-antitoxin module